MALESGIEELEPINMTPMIDVVFNLLIFFLLGSTYLSEEHRLELELPRVASAAPVTEAPDARTINVLADGRLLLEGTEVRQEELARTLRAARRDYPDLAVMIRGDRQVPYERVAQVLSICRDAGITRLDFTVIETGAVR